MGCNGSKQQQDVATGNTVTRGLFRRKSVVSESTSPSSTSTSTTVTDEVVINDGCTKHVEAPPAIQKADADDQSSADKGETKQNPSSSVDDVIGCKAVNVDAHSTDVVHVDHAGETAAPATATEQGKTDEVSEVKVAESDVAQKEDADDFSNKADDEESNAKHSMDFKETVPLNEGAGEEEGMRVSEINNIAKADGIEKGFSTD